MSCGNVTGIKLIHHNIQGLLSKFIDVHEWLEACVNSASVFCFTETWRKPEISLPSVSGYQVIHSPFIACTCKSNVAGRCLPGSCLFVFNNLLPEYFTVCVEIENSCTLLNVSCCLLRCQHYEVAVASVYRSPYTDVSKCLEDLHGLLSQLFVFL